MNRLAIVVGVLALVIGLAAGYVQWGRPTTSLQSDLRNATTRADHLEQQLGELRSGNQRLETQLRAEQSKLEAVERDLRGQKELNSRLQMVISHGKK
jgi:predicted  nucleic acid-binding Zn-ribbon protein